MAAPAATPRDLIAPAAAPGYAGLVSRAIALGIDAAVVQGTLLVIAALLALVASLVGGVRLESLGQAIAAAAWILATAAYFVIGWSATGQTLGMRAMELRVVTSAGLVPKPARSVVRVLWLGLCILPLFAGFLPVLFDQRRRGLHDMVSGTVVVHVPPVAPLEDTT
jgi:uncharacterized RDD family membrane protein YckC